MIRNKHTPLPLHHGAPSGSNGGINAAIDKGLNLVGLAATKTGSGEKERAYVVKQNSLLKGMLFVVVIATVVLIVVFSTVFELRVARRGLVISEVAHHKKEHHDHEEIIRTSLELQEALHATIEETNLVDEFRAYFDKAVGTSDDMIDHMFADSGVSPKVIDRAREMQRDFVKQIEIKLGKILNRFHKRAAEAKHKVSKLAKMMGSEIDHDADAKKKYEEKLNQLGVDEQYAEKLEEQYEEEEEEGEDGMEINPDELTEEEKKMTMEQVKEKRKREQQEDDQEAEREVESQLELFFKKLNELQLPSITPEKITLLESTLQLISNTLQDETKETDLELVIKKMDETIMANAPGTLQEKFDASKHDSVLDFYSGFIERAKLAPHKQTLMDMYNGWKSPDSGLTSMQVLAAIENVAFKENLMKIFDLLEGNEMDPSTDTDAEHEKEPVITSGGEEIAKARRSRQLSAGSEEPENAVNQEQPAASGDAK